MRQVLWGAGRRWLQWAVAASLVWFVLPALRADVGTFQQIYQFTGGSDGASPGRLVLARDGNLYGTTTAGQGTIFKLTPGGVLTTLYTFTGAPDGQNPVLYFQGIDDALYGSTVSGGSGFGTVFRVSTGGALTTLHSFAASDGSWPAALVQTSDGSVYGAARYGGDPACTSFDSNGDCGTIFKISPSGSFTVVHAFEGPDGLSPDHLVLGTDGNLYGSAPIGGPNSCGPPSNCGTAFRITPAGGLTVIHAFQASDGGSPYGIIQGADGNLYGTTQLDLHPAPGTLFRLTTEGALTVLYQFTANTGPPGDLTQGSDGNLYLGAADSGCNCSVLYRYSSASGLSAAHSFTGSNSSGPTRPVQAADGVLYDTTPGGGLGKGTAYSLASASTGGGGSSAGGGSFSWLVEAALACAVMLRRRGRSWKER